MDPDLNERQKRNEASKRDQPSEDREVMEEVRQSEDRGFVQDPHESVDTETLSD